jgi:sugar phosphate isomerase/epimerase
LKIGISASAVLSQTERLAELFRQGIDHIEIGLFENVNVAESFIRRARRQGKTVGIHSPLLRGGSKYDLLQSIDMPQENAWEQIEQELVWCSRFGATYLLVHFPYAHRSGVLDLPLVQDGIKRLSALQRRTGVKIVCEPKLGDDRDPAGIRWLRTAPTHIFSNAGLTLCWDVGDHLLANVSETEYFSQFERWRESISIIHLHNVRMEGVKYRWVPPHPTRSAVNGEHDLAPIIRRFPRNVTIVSEYTPQQVATAANIDTSYHYLRALTQRDGNA